MSDRYQIRDKIGQGGLGAVYRAYDTHLRREVALKRLLPPEESESLGEDPTEALFKEAHLLSALQHPNVVSVYDVGTDAEGMFVVMELVEGETFDEVVERGLLTENDFAEMVAQTLEALIAAQAKDMVHRDIKPSNLMVKWLPSGKFQFKLLDFGLAKFSAKASLQTIDLGNTVLGSIHFMAPEQFERAPIDGRTDLYAMACVYYFGLSGFYPFDGETGPEVMAAHLQHHVTPLRELRPDISKRNADWIMWLMSRDIDARPASAQEASDVYFNPAIPVPGAAPAKPRARPGGGPATGPVVVRPPTFRVRLPVPAAGPAGAPADASPPGAGKGLPRRIRKMGPGKRAVPRWLVPTMIVLGVFVTGGLYLLTSGGGEKKDHARLMEYLESNTRQGDASWVRVLVPYLDSAASRSRYIDDPAGFSQHVAGKLREMEGGEVDAALAGALDSCEGAVRSRLIEIVTQRKSVAAVDSLTRIALGGDDKAATEAIQALKVLGSPSPANVGTALEAMMTSDDPATQRVAGEMLEALIDKATNKEELVPALERGVRKLAPTHVKLACVSLLQRTGVPPAADAVARVMERCGHPEIEQAAAKALGEWPGGPQFERLAQLAAQSRNPGVRDHAFDAFLGAMAGKRPEPGDVASWEKALEAARSTRMKQQFLQAISAVPEPFARDLVARFEADADPTVRSQAAQAKARIERLIQEKGSR